MKIKKTNGNFEFFAQTKIINSLQKNPELSQKTISHILSLIEIKRDTTPHFSTEMITQIIYETLEEPLKTNFISRHNTYKKEKIKNFQNSTSIETFIKPLQQQEQSIVNENANKDSTVFNTQRDLTAGAIAKSIGLKLLPPHVAQAHLNGDIHYHDLDYHPYMPMTNCCLIDFKYMLSNGFQIGNAQVENPKSIQTATAQMAQIIANVASSQYGGCSADRIDEILAPYAKLNYQKHIHVAKQWITDIGKQEQYAKERVSKDIYDAMQSLEYEINTLYSSQGQTPFTTLGFGLGTSWFEREIQKAILTVRIKGLGKEKRTAIFPKLVFTLKRGTNLDKNDPNYDIKQLAIECATKRMYPDVLNYDKIVALTGSFKVPMGCRSFLQGWENEQHEEVNAGRMNLGVVTLNLPRLALQSDNNITRFWQLLDDKLSICHDALLYRIKRVKEAKPENAPILYQHGAFGMKLEKHESVDTLFANKRATISLGYIGLYEVATIFFGSEWENNPVAKQFTLDILKLLKQHTDVWSQQYHYHFSVYATPSESLTDRFCKLDKQRFGSIPHITEKDYYTNSFHYDVRKNPTPFEKITFEQDYAPFSSGGFIHYCEYPNMRRNPKALESVWDFAYDRIGYLGTNTPIDHCYKCGFDGDFLPTARGFKCPNCHNTDPKTCDVVKRTCGYLGNPQARPMVHGRHIEITSRVKHLKERHIQWHISEDSL